jgi:hypothetical protein
VFAGETMLMNCRAPLLFSDNEKGFYLACQRIASSSLKNDESSKDKVEKTDLIFIDLAPERDYCNEEQNE